jgi:hypothetical protein
MNVADIDVLVSIFARYHSTGWQIPVWLDELARKHNAIEVSLPTFYVIDWSH